MKKYATLLFMCFPFVVFGAPSVRSLGVAGTTVSAASGGATTLNKAVPAKARNATSKASNSSRVGSLRARATTTGTSNIGTASVSRFPVILPSKVYSSVNSPRPTGGHTTIVNTDTSEIEERLTVVEDTVNNYHEPQIQENTENINKVEKSPKFDSIRVANDFPFTGDELPDERAWIWVEE